MFTALRISETVALDVDDVRIMSRKGVLVVIGKGEVQREVPLNALVRQVLDEWLEQRKDIAADVERAMFVSRTGGRLSARSADRDVRLVAAAAGLQLSAHTLRHTCLTALVRRGNDLVMVAELAGPSEAGDDAPLHAAVVRQSRRSARPHGQECATWRCVPHWPVGMPPPRSRVELYAAIRRDARSGLSMRELQRKHNVGYRTVAAASRSAWPEPRKKPSRRGSRLDPYRDVIDDWLRADLDAPRKQRHTAKRIFDRLLDEHQAVGIVSYGMVREYVATRRREIRVEAGREPANTFVPQQHQPGREAEVDFGEVAIRLRGELVTCTLFCLRLSYSGKAVHRISATAGQEAFFEGHVHAFNVLGGVPVGKIRYDNLKAAVAQVIGFSRRRVETDRWTAVRSHYGIDAFYCQPGIGGAHEKGGVEGDVGRFRRNHLVPIVEVNSISELNAMVDAWDLADEQRRIGTRARTVGEHFAAEQPLLRPLPDDAFETGSWFSPRVNRYAQITVRTNTYSVPARFVGRQVRVLLHASELVVYEGRAEVARHERVMTKGGTRVDLDHYLEVLLRKPGALPGATALEQARAAGRFTAVHDAWWAAARKSHGDKEGTRALIEVLLLHRRMPHEQVLAGLKAALDAGALTADAVALEARKLADQHDEHAPPPLPDKTAQAHTAVRSLTEQRLRAHLREDTRPLPSVDKYDRLLSSRRPYRNPS